MLDCVVGRRLQANKLWLAGTACKLYIHFDGRNYRCYFDDLHGSYVLSNAIHCQRSETTVKKDVCHFDLPAFICSIPCDYNQCANILNKTQAVSTLFIVDRSCNGTVDQLSVVSIWIYSLFPFSKSDQEMSKNMSSSENRLTS